MLKCLQMKLLKFNKGELFQPNVMTYIFSVNLFIFGNLFEVFEMIA